TTTPTCGYPQTWRCVPAIFSHWASPTPVRPSTGGASFPWSTTRTRWWTWSPPTSEVSSLRSPAPTLNTGSGVPGKGTVEGAVLDPDRVQAVQMLTQAWFELGVVAGAAGPHLLGECGQTWKDHVVQAARGVDVLGPHVDLCAQDMCRLLLGHLLGDGFGGVDVFCPEQRAHRNGFVGVLGLLVVQVGSGGGGHDHVVA